jgi:cytoskeletal protein CcmA (bactofilin family)
VSEKRHQDGELSLFAAGTSIDGKITTEGSIRLDGKFVGDLVARGNAAVGPTGTVEGTIMAENVSVAGVVQGSIRANNKLILEAKSAIRGDIHAATLVIDEGARFDGNCAMSGEGGPPKSSGVAPPQKADEKR